MKRIAFAAVALAGAILFAWPMIPALSQWGGRACILPAQTPPVGGLNLARLDMTQFVQGPMIEQKPQPFRGNTYQWKIPSNDPERAYLYKNGTQIGGWDAQRQVYRELVDHSRNVWGPPQERAPIDPPAHLVRQRPDVERHPLEAWQLGGVKVDEMCKHERYSINGQNVSFQDAQRAITAGLDDDSSKLWLSVWSKDPQKRAKIVSDLQASGEVWKWVIERCHLWDGPAANPEHWQEKDREGRPLHQVRVDPTITLQAPDGTELWRDEGYGQGPQGFELIRKADPKFNPDLTPGPNRKGGGGDDIGLYVLLGGIALLALVLFPGKDNHAP